MSRSVKLFHTRTITGFKPTNSESRFGPWIFETTVPLHYSTSRSLTHHLLNFPATLWLFKNTFFTVFFLPFFTLFSTCFKITTFHFFWAFLIILDRAILWLFLVTARWQFFPQIILSCSKVLLKKYYISLFSASFAMSFSHKPQQIFVRSAGEVQKKKTQTSLLERISVISIKNFNYVYNLIQKAAVCQEETHLMLNHTDTWWASLWCSSCSNKGQTHNNSYTSIGSFAHTPSLLAFMKWKQSVFPDKVVLSNYFLIVYHDVLMTHLSHKIMLMSDIIMNLYNILYHELFLRHGVSFMAYYTVLWLI